ncbi:MAG: adenylosuccinate synthase [Cyanobacteria bacterium TGS_CYA1]|nr:adenylosuccinate synthase [Cyanobacteria bacterium TGS_CYA1]MDX2108447.1 adenylosuccinate synthase [Candidatus Melainabacteria bacterium]
MANVVVVGAQFGDEGKAKVTDLLAMNADVVVRYQGGANAGHTVVVGNETYKFHLIPSGIVYKGKQCILGPGMVIDPKAFLTEMQALIDRGLDDSNLKMSTAAHVTMPYHLMIDAAEEESRGDKKIGTTKRGIGPTYADKCARTGIRVEDLLNPSVLKEKLEWMVPRKNVLFERMYNLPQLDVNQILEEYLEYGKKIKKYVCDTSALIFEAVGDRKNILFEGAQGTLLDLDHGTYPYVTSSSPSAGGACVGAGIGPTIVDRVIGVSKAYMTRVGEGYFPTELFGEEGERIREIGAEVGVTTGRPRRCGWFDAVLGRYAVRINGLDCLAITKMDVLDGFDEIKVCIEYKNKETGKVYKDLPSIGAMFAQMEPVYKTLKGWKQSTVNCRKFSELPDAAQKYLEFIEQELDVPVAIVSVGPKRDNTIIIEDPIHGPKRVLSKAVPA